LFGETGALEEISALCTLMGETEGKERGVDGELEEEI
jgi:hypothetical protein